MNRTSLCVTLLLHGAVLLTAWAGRGPVAALRQRDEGRVTVSLRLLNRTTGPQGPAAQAPGGPPPLPALRPPLIALPDLSRGLTLPAPAAGMQPGQDSPAVSITAPATSPSAADRSPPQAAPPLSTAARDQAPEPPELLPAALPPDHQACKARQADRHYPAMLRDRGIEGRVVVRVKVDEDGHASEVLVQSPSGWRLMDEAARQVAAACPYHPARRGEQRLMAWIEYPIRFTLH